MAKLSYLLRKNGKAVEETVCIRHFHKTKDTEFVRSVGIKVVPSYFDLATGRVSSKLSSSPEANATIQQVSTDIETASRNLLGKGIHPSKEAMTAEYERIVAARAAGKQRQPISRSALNKLDSLKAELADLIEQVEGKRQEIEQAELQLGVHQGKLLSTYIAKYKEERQETAAHNTTRLYAKLVKTVTSFNAVWRIDEVNDASLKAFEKWLIGQKKKNLTITDTITKIKTVVYAYAKELRLDVVEVREHKTNVKKKSNTNVVYLHKNELQELIDLPLTNEVEAKVRDRFVLMCLTGLRFSDTVISPENIFNGDLLFSTEKTDTDLSIPISPLVEGLLARYSYTLPKYPAQYFNKVIKRICQQVPSLSYKVQLKEYRGKNKADKSVKYKCEAVSAHCGRRTFINLALLKGVNPVAIASIVGHEGIDLIMRTYGSKEAGKALVAELMSH
jgi:hypothetical protein